MNLESRLQDFINLGKYLSHLSETEKQELADKVYLYNHWFTPDNVRNAIDGIVHLLNESDLQTWISRYTFSDHSPRKVGVVMAGNIPGVGFHDFLCVLLSGNILYAKLSSQDEMLIKFITSILLEINDLYKERIFFAERLNDMDAMIATGSDNTSRYFEYYFSKIPHIIRKNRTAVAVLNGNETVDDLQELSKDIFLYFGLGCRNISKLYVPEGYNFKSFFEATQPFDFVRNHHKYNNNYEYNRSVYLINQVFHYDNGFLMLLENENIVSPMSVLYFEYYQNEDDLKDKLAAHQEKIQCIVCKDAFLSGSFAFGQAQYPKVWDYADGVDTMQFLTGI
jgi:hypothetical protein